VGARTRTKRVCRLIPLLFLGAAVLAVLAVWAVVTAVVALLSVLTFL
jgi:hypothetical protein